MNTLPRNLPALTKYNPLTSWLYPAHIQVLWRVLLQEATTATVTGHKPSLPSPWFCQARYFISQAFAFALSDFNMSSAATGRDTPAPKRKRQNAGVVDDDIFRKPRGSDGCFDLVPEGIKNRMQVEYCYPGVVYRNLSSNTRHYYTDGPIPAAMVEGTAHPSRYGQTVVQVKQPLETMVKLLVWSSPQLRRAIDNPKVKRFTSNFFPMCFKGDGDDEDQSGTSIYLKKSKKTPPFETEKMDEVIDVYVFPSKMSRNLDGEIVQCTIGVVNTTLPSNVGLRRFDAERFQHVEQIDDAETVRLTEGFLQKWRKSTQECASDDEDEDIFKPIPV